MLGEQTQKIKLELLLSAHFSHFQAEDHTTTSSSLLFSFILILFCIIVNKLYVIAVI